MTRFSRSLALTLAVLAAVILSLPVQAQPPQEGPRRGPGRIARGMGGGMFGGGNSLWLLRMEQIQEELAMTDEQKAKLNELGQEMMSEMREQFSGMRDLDAEQRRAKWAELREKMAKRAEAFRKKTEAVLLPEQRARMKQIRVRMLGSRAFSDKEVIETLGITEEQTATFEAIREAVRGKMRKLFEGMDWRAMDQEQRRQKGQEIGEKARQLQQEAVKEALGVLTEEQIETLNKMKGEEFELDRSRLFRGGRIRQAPREGATPRE